MGNSRHIFKFACSEKLPFSGNSKNPEIKEVKKVKLVSEDNTKEIEFHGSYFGSYYIFKPDGESNEKFQLFVHRTKDNDTGEEVYLSDPIDLESIRVKVTLDNQCKYTIALSLGNNEWITLPRSSLSYINYDDLKKYYNKNLQLSHSNIDNRVPSIMYGQEKVCELALISAPICLDDNNNIRIATVTLENGIGTDYLNDSRLVIEKDENNQLLIYLSDRGGNPIDIWGRTNEIHSYFNVTLQSALLENSDIREVLPELKIDDNVNLDTRQLSCWINNTSTIQKITDESFKDSVKDLLKSDPEFTNSVKGERGLQGLSGRKGEDADPAEVVRKWANDSSKRYIISQEIVNNEDFQGAVKYLLKQDSKFKSGVGDVLKSDDGFRDSVKDLLKSDPEFTNSVKGERGPQGLPGRKGEDADPAEVVRKWANDSSKRYIISQEIVNNEDFQGAVKYLLKQDSKFKSGVGDVLKSDDGFRDSVKGDPGKGGESPSADAVAQELITNKVNELGQAVLEAKDDKGKEILVNNPDLQEGVAEKLRENPGKTKGPKGEQGPQGLEGKQGPQGERGSQGLQGRKGEDADPAEVVRKWANDSSKRYIISQEIVNNEDFQGAVKYLLKQDSKFKSGVGDVLKSDDGFRDSVKGDPGKDGKNPPVDAVAAQLMNDDNRNTLVTEVAKNEDLQKSVAGNQDLRDAVAINLKTDETFQTTVKGDPGKDGESPPVDAVAQELITNKVNELGQAVLEARDDKGKEILVNNPDLQEGVAEKLRGNPGKTKGPKGDTNIRYWEDKWNKLQICLNLSIIGTKNSFSFVLLPVKFGMSRVLKVPRVSQVQRVSLAKMVNVDCRDQREIEVITMHSRNLLCKKEKNYWTMSMKQILFQMVRPWLLCQK